MKKLLMIGIRYFNYPQAIIAEFEHLGYAVTFHDIEPWTPWLKLLLRLAPAYLRKVRDRQHQTIMEMEKDNKYDVVFFLQTHQFSVRNIELLRRQHAEARFVLYNWDSLATHDFRPNMHAFDAVFTADRVDANALGVHYLPMFCMRQFQNLDRSKADPYTVYFVGKVQDWRRYAALTAFKDYCMREGIRFDHHIKCSLSFLLQMLGKGVIPRGVTFSAIAREAFTAKIEGASAVFDFPNHAQSCLVMRILESLCAGKKLITNNPYILDEAFYSPDRILVYRDLDFSGVKAFLEQPLAKPDEKFEEFYIQNFAKKLLSLD